MGSQGQEITQNKVRLTHYQLVDDELFTSRTMRLFPLLFLADKRNGNRSQCSTRQNTRHHLMSGHGQPTDHDHRSQGKYKTKDLTQILRANICNDCTPLYFAGMFAFLFSHFENAFSAAGNDRLKLCQLIRWRNRARPRHLLMHGYLISRILFTGGQRRLRRIITGLMCALFAHAQNGRQRDLNTYPPAQSYCICALLLFGVSSIRSALQNGKNRARCGFRLATIQKERLSHSYLKSNTPLLLVSCLSHFRV